MERPGLAGVLALLEPDHPYQSAVALGAVVAFVGLIAVSVWVYLHWVWARDAGLPEPPMGGPRVVVVAGHDWTVPVRTTRASIFERGPTAVADLFGVHPRVVAERLQARLVELELLSDVAAGLGQASSSASGGSGASPGFDVVQQVAEKVADQLGEPLGQFLQAVWHEHPDVQATCLDTVGRRGATRQVVVRRCRLESVHRPTVVLELDGARTPLLHVVLSLTLDVDDIAVDVAQGEVVGTGEGLATSRVELTLARPGGVAHSVLSRSDLPLTVPAYRRPDAQAVSAEAAAAGRSRLVTGGIPGARRM